MFSTWLVLLFESLDVYIACSKMIKEMYIYAFNVMYIVCVSIEKMQALLEMFYSQSLNPTLTAAAAHHTVSCCSKCFDVTAYGHNKSP